MFLALVFIELREKQEKLYTDVLFFVFFEGFELNENSLL